MLDAETPLAIQIGFLFAAVVLSTLLLRAWLPSPEANDARPAAERVVRHGVDG